ncbi:MAG: HAMP domain-containing protein [Candidatus Omnitrophica bacterium]|nr:HAMP domain-containing protein [Candidatus Omnitrophota bacterium]
MRINIHYKITMMFCLILAVILCGFFAYLDVTLKDYIFSRIKTALTKEVLLSKLFLEKDFPGYPRLKEIDEIADKAGENLETRVTIIGLDGKVLGDSDLDEKEIQEAENHLGRPEVQEALKGGIGQSRRFSTTVRKNMLYIATVFGKEKPEGFVRLSLPLSDVDIVSEKLKKMLLYALLMAFLVSVLVSFFASFYISKPIKNISTGAAGIAKGNFSKKIFIRTNDEIGDLASTFNNMAEEVRSRIDEITGNKARLEAVFLSMFDGLMIVDAKGNIVLMNKSIQNMFMITKDPTGRKPLEVIRNIEVQESVDKLLKTTSRVESREISILIPAKKTLIIHGTPIMRDGKIEGAVLVVHDITEIRRLENIRKDFVANVSHELRTPVSSIKGFAETLVNGALDDKENAMDFVKIIESNADRLVRMIDDLLDLAKIETGKVKLNLRPCSIPETADKVIKDLAKAAKEKSISIENKIDKNISDIKADESMIMQVFYNLIDNAIKYSNNGGAIIISSEEQANLVSVKVSDTGIGIPEKDLARVFERFYCVDKTRSRKSGGTGLGLSIIKHIVEEHGGRVSVESTLAQGSIFTFTLPKTFFKKLS